MRNKERMMFAGSRATQRRCHGLGYVIEIEIECWVMVVVADMVVGFSVTMKKWLFVIPRIMVRRQIG